MADDELFGLDGTQSPPPPPLEIDPLAGLLTGSVFADRTSEPESAVAGPGPGTVAPAAAARRLRPRTAPTRVTPARPAPPRVSPAGWQPPRSMPRPPPARRGAPGRPAQAPGRSVPSRKRASA